MTKIEIVEKISDQLGFTKKEALEYLEAWASIYG